MNNSLSAIDEIGCGHWLLSRITAAGIALNEYVLPHHACSGKGFSAPVVITALMAALYLRDGVQNTRGGGH